MQSRRGAGAATTASKAKNRFSAPSSAVSLPSLTLEEGGEEEGGGGGAPERGAAGGGLEKSASSASIVRTKEGKVARLGKRTAYDREWMRCSLVDDM